MPFTLQMLRTLIEAHPDRASRLKVHVEALETTIVGEPARCLERVRALFEATHLTIGPHLGIVFLESEDFPARNSRVFKALDFALKGHPEEDKIDKAIKKLVGSINGTIGALAELSNIPGIRHGGSLDWNTLERQHAYMLGGLCDTLISFLFDIAWGRASDDTMLESRYEDWDLFNASIDDEYDEVEIVGSLFLPSKILYTLDPIQYEAAKEEWQTEQVNQPIES